MGKLNNLLGFLKPKEEVMVADTIKDYSNPKNYPLEVLQIHHEFEVAADKLVEQANEIINTQPAVNQSKIERLAKFGFKQVKEVAEGTQVLKATEMSREQIERVQYYRQHYPFNKFITETQVKEICYKYNLVCGDVARFTGFVPDSNLRDIENFRLKDVDKGLLCRKADGTSFYLEDAEIKDSPVDSKFCHIYKVGETDKYRYAFQSNDNNGFGGGRQKGVHFYASDERNIFGMADLGNVNFIIENASFKICAPVKDMDISGLELKEGYKLERKIEIPDPVVLQPVKGGYLVVTAWGDEASDALIVNENFN